MSYKHNCTKGPAPSIMNGSDNGWATCTMQRDGLHVVVTAPYAGEMDNGEWDHPEKVHEAEANAALIAEAFNILHETGMTPRELADLLERLAELLTDIQNRDDDRPRELTHGEYDDLCRIVTAYEQAEP